MNTLPSDENNGVIKLQDKIDEARLKIIDERLKKSDKHTILPIVSNAAIIIAEDPKLANLLAFDDFDLACSENIKAPPPGLLDSFSDLPGPYPRPWGKVDILSIQSYLQRAWGSNMARETVADAMSLVSAQNRYHPVRDWLAGLNWDGISRVDTWVNKAFGVAIEDEYAQTIGSKFLIAAVRRVRQPGVKFDHMPILEGAQDMGKSTAVATLFGAKWFADSIPAKLETPDAALALQGVWCIEFAEIEQIIRSEVEVIKAFLSRSTDRFRAPYGRGFLRYPRQCVLIGTTNDDNYLRDATGNRRFWPIKCQHVDLAWIRDNREQLWAEAAKKESAGSAHWLTKEESDVSETAAGHQADRMQDDPWRERVLEWVNILSTVSIPQIMTEALSLPIGQQGKREQMRVATILRAAGWVRKLTRDAGAGPGRRWERPK